MIRRIVRALPALVLSLAVPLGACRKSEKAAPVSETSYSGAAAPVAGLTPSPAAGAVQLVDVQLGSAVRGDNTVQTATETFSPNDTVHASVKTEGAGTATIEAKWTYSDGKTEKTVKTDSRTINPTGPAITEFSIQKPGGWPAGNYKVEISISGNPTGISKGFKVV